MVTSSSPMGTRTPSNCSISAASRSARGTPRRRSPASSSPLLPWLRSSTSWAMRVSARRMPRRVQKSDAASRTRPPRPRRAPPAPVRLAAPAVAAPSPSSPKTPPAGRREAHGGARLTRAAGPSSLPASPGQLKGSSPESSRAAAAGGGRNRTGMGRRMGDNRRGRSCAGIRGRAAVRRGRSCVGSGGPPVRGERSYAGATRWGQPVRRARRHPRRPGVLARRRGGDGRAHRGGRCQSQAAGLLARGWVCGARYRRALRLAAGRGWRVRRRWPVTRRRRW